MWRVVAFNLVVILPSIVQLLVGESLECLINAGKPRVPRQKQADRTGMR